MDLLVYLARHSGRVVSAEDLLEDLWTDKIVTGSTVYNCVAELRQALANGQGQNAYIETVPKKGYRLLAPVVGIGSAEQNTAVTGTYDASKRGIVLLLGASTFFALAILGTLLGRGQTPGDPPSAPSLQLPLLLPNIASTWSGLALSSDGRQIAYIGNDETDVNLYLKRADLAVAQRIPQTAGARTPFFSPNGEWVGYFANGKLMRIRVDGGDPIEIEKVPGNSIGASWGDDDKIIFNVGYRSVLQRISISGGVVESITVLADKDVTHRHAHVLPGANAILYQVGSQNSVLQSDPATIWLLDLHSREKRYLIDGAYPKFANGKLLFLKFESNGRSLWSIDFDLDDQTVSGVAVPLITDPVQTYDVSHAGSLIYSQPRRKLKHELRIVDQAGIVDLTDSSQTISHPRFSGDGKSLAVAIGSVDQRDIWIFKLGTGESPIRVTTNGGSFPAWSFDDRSIAYYRWATGIFTQKLDSLVGPEHILEFDGLAYPLQWRTDGILYSQANPNTHGDIYFRPTNGDRISIDADKMVSLNAAISPNGRWIAYSRIDSSRPQVFVKAFPHGARSWRVSPNGGDNPKWSSDGSKLYFVSNKNIVSRTVVEDSPISFGQTRLEYELSASTNITSDPFDLSADGERLAIADAVYDAPPSHIFVSNWQSLLKK